MKTGRQIAEAIPGEVVEYNEAPPDLVVLDVQVFNHGAISVKKFHKITGTESLWKCDSNTPKKKVSEG